MQAKTELAKPGMESPTKRMTALLEKPPQEAAKRIPDLVADLRFDRVTYSEAGSLVRSIEDFSLRNKDMLLTKGEGIGKEYWHRGEPPFFSDDQKQDKEYIKTYNELLKLAEINEGLSSYKNWIVNHPEALDDPKLGYEDKIYRYVKGGESGHFKIDLGSTHILTRSGGIGDHLFAQETRNSQQFKVDAAAYENLRIDPDSLKFGSQIQLFPKVDRLEPERIGRIYINPSTGDYQSRSNVITMFNYFTKQFNENPDLYYSMKVLDFSQRLPWAYSGGEATDKIQGDLNSSDKIVIYFDMDKYDAVVKGVQKQYEGLYEPHQLLYSDHPLFSVTLPNSPDALDNRHFKSMSGISFAEDPAVIKGERTRSRNQTIAEVLRRATKEVGLENINTEKFDEAIRKQFEYFKIDPDNPAFNLRSEPEVSKRVPGDPSTFREYERRQRERKKAA